MKNTKNIFSGSSAEAPSTLPPNSLYFSTDSGQFIPYDKTGRKGEVGSGVSSIPVVDEYGGKFLHDTTLSTSVSGPGDYWLTNLFIGQKSGSSTLSTGVNLGVLNVGVGPGTLQSLTTGIQNVMIGSENGALMTTAGQNIGIGDAVLYYAVSGVTNNMAIGKNVLQNLTTGSYNVAIGRNAGFYAGTGTTELATASNHILIGENTRPSANGTVNEIVIGSDTVGEGSNTATFGHTNIVKTILRGTINAANLLTFADDTAASSLATGDLYKTATGEVRYKL